VRFADLKRLEGFDEGGDSDGDDDVLLVTRSCSPAVDFEVLSSPAC